MDIQTTRVPAMDAAGYKVSVERQTIVICREGRPAEIGHQYHYDNSHVGVEPNGVLVVLATGDKLQLCGEDPPEPEGPASHCEI